MNSFLTKILKFKRAALEHQKKNVQLRTLEKGIEEAPPVRNFSKAICRPSQIRLIAEIKKASPSRGIIRAEFDPLEIASIYEKSGVAAISVLTEEKFFLGHPRFLKEIRKKCLCPLLRKDFIFDEYQIFESRYLGADALLLITAILSEIQLKQLLKLTEALGMQALVEVHNQSELGVALRAGARLVGVNNRDLNSFDTHLSTAVSLGRFFPHGIARVAESGLFTHKDVIKMKRSGYHAVLIGEAIIKKKNIGEKIRELMGYNK